MDILALKNSAIELRKTLENYKEKEPAVLDLHDHLEQLIAAAERGEITTPLSLETYQAVKSWMSQTSENIRTFRKLTAPSILNLLESAVQNHIK